MTTYGKELTGVPGAQGLEMWTKGIPDCSALVGTTQGGRLELAQSLHITQPATSCVNGLDLHCVLYGYLEQRRVLKV